MITDIKINHPEKQRYKLGALLVQKRRITSQQLRRALDTQKQSGQALGKILIDQQIVSRHTIYRTIAQQFMMRGMLTLATAIIGFSSLGISKTVHAESSYGVQNISYQPVSAYPKLFETAERKSSDISPFNKWTSMLSRFEREKQQILPYVQSNIATWRGQDLGVLAQNINHFVNQKTYTTDQKLWGKSDYWETPVEFFKRGGGDCEDFAITKYMLLRMMNVPKERLRIAIVNDTEKGIHHAILIVYTDQGSMFLDNQIKQATYTRASTRYEPIFSINEQSWWLHEQERNQGTMVASR